jgi:hypothetical protein
METEFPCEEEEFEWHERMLKRVAMEESRRIIQRMAKGYRPDIVDRILLRMAKKERKLLKSTKKG